MKSEQEEAETGKRLSRQGSSWGFRTAAVVCGLCLGALLCACATHYDLTLRNGDVVRAESKPKLNERGYYVFKDHAGQEVEINQMRVRQIEPVRPGSRPSSPFNDTPKQRR